MRSARWYIVRGLEHACHYSHPVVHHRPWLWLPLPVCPLATLSFRLDDRWHTGAWTEDGVAWSDDG